MEPQHTNVLPYEFFHHKNKNFARICIGIQAFLAYVRTIDLNWLRCMYVWEPFKNTKFSNLHFFFIQLSKAVSKESKAAHYTTHEFLNVLIFISKNIIIVLEICNFINIFASRTNYIGMQSFAEYNRI